MKKILFKSLLVLVTVSHVSMTTLVSASDNNMNQNDSQVINQTEQDIENQDNLEAVEGMLELSEEELEILNQLEKYYKDPETISSEEYEEYIQTPIEEYGQKVEVKGKMMNIYTIGDGEIPIVFIPGQGTITTKHQYHNLISVLKDNHRLVIIEPFGYGLSDVIDEPRTLENVADEIYQGIQKAGITEKFVLAAHSLGGIYSLKIMHDHPEQILGFIGMDTSTPGMEGGLQVEMPEFAMKELPKLADATEEINAQYYAIGDKVNNNPNMVDEANNGSNIINEGANYKIPEGIKALYLLAKESELGLQLRSFQIPIEGNWEEQHIAFSENPDDVTVKTLDGVHNIFDSNKEEVKSAIEEFMKQFEE